VSKENSITKSKLHKKVIPSIIELFNHNVFFLLASQLLIFFFGFLIILPVYNLGFEISLTTSGLNYLSLSNFPQFILNPFTLFFFIVIFIFLSILLVFEDVFLKRFFYFRSKNIPIKRINILYFSLKSTFDVFNRFRIRSIIYVWVLLFAFNLPFIAFNIRYHSLLRYIVSETSGLIIWIVLFTSYLISILLIQRRQKNSVFRHIGWNILQGVFFLILYIISIMVLLVLVSIFIPKEIAITAFISIFDRFNSLFSFTIFILSTLFHYALYTVTSSKALLLKDDDSLKVYPKTTSLYFSKSTKFFVSIMLFGVVLFDSILIFNITRHGSLLQTVTIDQVQVTSHRGFSMRYPENTLVSIEGAINAFADVVEMDVRVTQDNQFVILHDDNLLRTTGINVSVARLPIDVVTSIDAGRWFSPEFTGERIPSLIQALELTKGRINVNLDLKLTARQVDLIPDLVAIIDEYEMQYQVLLTSTCLPCLEKAKEVNPNIQTGFITYRINPSLLDNPLIDLVSMRSTFVTQPVVMQVQAANKKILVWTVNSRTEIERLSNLGVNNIITSRPDYVKQVLFELSADRFIMHLIRIILN
jgi:glycerophosphoryl diester phosphodiesterase